MKFEHMHCLFFSSLLGFIDLSTSEEFPYKIESVIKRGGHGIVFKGRSEFDSKQCVAIKAEDSKISDKLLNEYLIYSDLKDGKGTKLLLIAEEKEANDENLDTAKNYYIH